jgi:uncharacterized DUF497 family protein
MALLLFEWDGSKARSNFNKHGVSFEEATTIFGDPRAVTIESHGHSDKKRYVTIGRSSSIRVVIVVVHTDRNDRIRIISARPASRTERRQYEGK